MPRIELFLVVLCASRPLLLNLGPPSFGRLVPRHVCSVTSRSLALPRRLQLPYGLTFFRSPNWRIRTSNTDSSGFKALRPLQSPVRIRGFIFPHSKNAALHFPCLCISEGCLFYVWRQSAIPWHVVVCLSEESQSGQWFSPTIGNPSLVSAAHFHPL